MAETDQDCSPLEMSGVEHGPKRKGVTLVIPRH